MPGTRYDASTKAKAIRLVCEHAGDYPTRWAAIRAVSGRLGMSAETLRKWIRQAEVDGGKANTTYLKGEGPPRPRTGCNNSRPSHELPGSRL